MPSVSPTEQVHAVSREERGVLEFATISELVKFSGVAGILAMVVDAVVGHALLWQNDPYWTYWVTDTFLITSIYTIGTALIGASIVRGAVLTVVQMLILTTYYWTLSPIGLPGSPEWLDLEHTWVSGPPVHFGVYYVGYLVALWLWRRRTTAPEGRAAVSLERQADRLPGSAALAALLAALAIVVLTGLVQTLVLGEFPGVTWFVVRTLVLVPFLLSWWALAGWGLKAALVGGGVASILLLAYSHYVGPIGLPGSDLRILAPDSPPADVHWPSYTEEFLVMGPITIVVSLATMLIASKWHDPRRTLPRPTRRAVGLPIAMVAVVVGVGLWAAGQVGERQRAATVSTSGTARVETGAGNSGEFVAAGATLRLSVTDNNTKRTPLPPLDIVQLEVTVDHPDGHSYMVSASQPMVNDALGRFTTWSGVGYDVWHHGRSGIGTEAIGATRSEIAAYSLGQVRVDGELIATGVPVHVMTTDEPGVEVLVGSVEAPVAQLPDGQLRVSWADVPATSPEAPEVASYVLGGVVLLALLGAGLALAATRDPNS